MELMYAAILGIVEGVTEFLPISSTGHLILIGHWLQFEGPLASTFEVVIQLGAILAVVMLLWDRWLGMATGLLKGAEQAKRDVGFLCVTTLPALVVGFLIHGLIKRYLFSPLTVGLGLGVGGLAMIAVERWWVPGTRSGLHAMTWRDAWRIGFFQCLAMWPGISRSASTIMGGMTGGLDRRTATEYSFMAAVPVMFAATGYDLYKSRHLLSWSDGPMFGVGLAVSFVSAWMSIKWLLKWVGGHSFQPFGWYRIGLATLIMILLAN